MGTMGNSFGQGMLHAYTMPYQMQMYEYQTQMYMMVGLIVLSVLMCCCCCGFAACWFCYNKDEEKRKRKDEFRQEMRMDEMALKTIQVVNHSKQENRPRYQRHDSW